MSANRLKLNPNKTELIGTGSRHSVNSLPGSGPMLSLGPASIDVASAVRLLGVTITPDL